MGNKKALEMVNRLYTGRADQHLESIKDHNSVKQDRIKSSMDKLDQQISPIKGKEINAALPREKSQKAKSMLEGFK